MDPNTLYRVSRSVRRAAEQAGYNLEEAIVFGSRARGDHREHSDIDLLIVSPDFSGVPRYKRPQLFYRHWDYDALPDPEFICLTSEEFQQSRTKRPHIVRTAVEEGTPIA